MLKEKTRFFIKAMKYLPVLAFKGFLSTPATVLIFFSKGLPASIQLLKCFFIGKFRGRNYVLNINPKPLMEGTAVFFASMIVSDYIPSPRWSTFVIAVCLTSALLIYSTAAWIISLIMINEYRFNALKAADITFPLWMGCSFLIAIIISLLIRFIYGNLSSDFITIFAYGATLLCMKIINVFGIAQMTIKNDDKPCN